MVCGRLEKAVILLQSVHDDEVFDLDHFLFRKSKIVSKF
ncbi:hypothetical protein B4134_0246 [Bacillus safensis]|nr:hypothetical protein B4134_0246 [Bacillus safensis]